MIRLVLFTLMSALLALPVAAKSKKDTICEEFGAASRIIAEMRKKGSSEKDAQLKFVERNGSSPLLALQLVPTVSAYVYGLSKDELAGDVETPFVEQCKAS